MQSYSKFKRDYSAKNNQAYPPELSACPDYWKVLADGREKARLRREEINREAYLKNKTKLLQEAKEIKKFQQKEQTKKVEADFDKAQRELFEDDEEKENKNKNK